MNKVPLPIRCSIATLATMVFLASPTRLRGDEPEVKEFIYRPTSAVEGYLFTSEIKKSDIIRTGRSPSNHPVPPKGIGFPAAVANVTAAFRELEVGDHSEWLLFAINYQKYGGVGWVYTVEFVKQNAKSPTNLSKLKMTVLLDGTVIPVKRRRNGGEPE